MSVRWHSAALTIALALMALAALPGVGAAAIRPGAATLHTRDVTIAPNGVRAATITCPSGTRAIGGGAAFRRATGGFVSDPFAKLVSSAPRTDGRSWHAAGMSFEDQPILLRVSVLCQRASQVGSYTVRTKDLRVGDVTGGTVRGSVGCPAGQRVIMGGVLWNPGTGGANGADNLLVSTITPNGKGWRATGFAFGSPDHVMRIVALCRPTSSVSSATIRRGLFPMQTTGDRGGRVGCPDGRRALTGGAEWVRDGDPVRRTGSLSGTSITRDARAWFASGDLLDEEIDLAVTVLCVKA
ncbi:MAG: hypothetical protein KF809_02630 [Chloroflexi bacterium]|nr:hypothetical protein [Chloroflexota bacterium]